MAGEGVTEDDVLKVVDASILSGPEDAIWDNIFDWIQNAIGDIVDSVTGFIGDAVGWIVDNVRSVVDVLLSPFRAAFDWVKSHLGAVWDWVVDTYHLVSEWVSNAYDTVRSAVSSAINVVQSWLSNAVSSTWSFITGKISQVWTWITTSISNLSSTISAWFTQQWSNISSQLSTLWSNIGNWFSTIGTNIASFFTDLWERLEATWDWLTTWMTENIVAPLTSWWDQFLEKVFDFGEWVGGLLQAAWDWVSRDVPGKSPWYEDVIRKIGGWTLEILWEVPLELAEKIVSFLSPAIAQVMRPVGIFFNQIFETFMEVLEGFITALGPTNPDLAGTSAKSLTSVGLTAIAGLAGMTLAGSWLKPLGGAGMGHIAAMIYDMTNFKIITGASITALTIAAIRTPMTYHFNELFRPNLLPERDFMELMSRRAFTTPEDLQNKALEASIQSLTGGDGVGYEQKYLGYRGYPDLYYGLFKEMANTPLRYFPLAGIARTGFYDKVWFTEALARSGYSETAKTALHVMYQKMRDEVLQGSMSGAAVTRYKEGFTTEAQFKAEMELLAYSPEQADKYLIAAEMDYATDYLRDLLSAYQYAVRNGHIDMDEFRQRLLGLGIVPERVEAYVLKERVRLKPEEDLTAVSVPKPAYETEAGKVQVDTIRRQRRKSLITRDQEIDKLLGLGMAVDYATAVSDNDDVRLAEKVGED